MIFPILADLVLGIHAAFIAFVVLGALLALRWPRVALVHLPACVWAVWIELSGSSCPLTPLENSLRRAAGESAYAGGFIEHHLVPVIYPPGLTPRIQLWIAISIVLVNAVLYVWVLRRRRARARAA